MDLADMAMALASRILSPGKLVEQLPGQPSLRLSVHASVHPSPTRRCEPAGRRD